MDRLNKLDGFSISPLSLPLEKKVFMPKIDPFEGIFGVFADSLPDGWGRLLVDRLMRRNGWNPYEIGQGPVCGFSMIKAIPLYI